MSREKFHFIHTNIIPTYGMIYTNGILSLEVIHNDNYRELEFISDGSLCIIMTDKSFIRFYAPFAKIEEVGLHSTNYRIFNLANPASETYTNFRNPITPTCLSNWDNEQNNVPIGFETNFFDSCVIVQFENEYKVLFFADEQEQNKFISNQEDTTVKVLTDFMITEAEYNSIPKIKRATLIKL